ncbi:MAG TPA: CHRD domain-containing protein [Gemmatimonadaceae bacterium]|nr:CHRD domain-containing protein [Gemmatimonadaceae bacterium]
MQKIRGIAAGLLAIATVAACSLDVGPQDREARFAELTGEKMIPPVEVMNDDEPSTGLAAFALEDGRIFHDLYLTNVDGATSATLHIGGPSENTPSVATLFTSAQSTGVTGTGFVVQNDRLDAGELTGGVSYQSVFDALRAGNAYVVVYTVPFPDGALRGQAVSATDL